MNNPYVDYYEKQIGRGIPGFKGLRHQRGYGLLSSLLSKALFPLFRTVASRINPASVMNIAGELLKSPGLTPGKPLADDIARIGATATGALINQLQKGTGKRKKYKRCVKRKRTSVCKRRPKRKVAPCKKKNKRKCTTFDALS